ncbi:hypothetical protein D9M72_640700 [compost metagenome]
MAEGAGDALGQHFGDTRHAAALRIGVVPALDADIDQWIGRRADPGLCHQRQEL